MNLNGRLPQQFPGRLVMNFLAGAGLIAMVALVGGCDDDMGGAGSYGSDSSSEIVGDTPEHGNWTTSLEEGMAQATELERPMMVLFTGSDWCPPCKALEREVFSSDEFVEWADAHVVAVFLDFPQNKPNAETIRSRNEPLAQEFKVEGFPTVIFMTPEKEILGKTSGYSMEGKRAWIARAEEMISSKS